MYVDEIPLSLQYVEPTSLALALFLSLSVAVMTGCAQAKVRHGMLSASESHSDVLVFANWLRSFTQKEKDHKCVHVLICVRATGCCCCFWFMSKHKMHKKSVHIDAGKVQMQIRYVLNVFVLLTYSTLLNH